MDDDDDEGSYYDDGDGMEVFIMKAAVVMLMMGSFINTVTSAARLGVLGSNLTKTVSWEFMNYWK